MLKYLLGTALTLAAMNASACTFSWLSYGDSAIRSKVDNKIGSYVSEQYCEKFNKDHEIVIQYNAYALSSMCVGHAIVSLRKRGTDTMQVNTRNSIFTDTDCRTPDAANDLAAQASLSALDDLMSELDTWKVN